jgi:hypothetical protein
VQPHGQLLQEVAAPEQSQNQLEFNFNSSPYTTRVFERLENIERKLATILDTQEEIFNLLKTRSSNKKKA